MNQQQITKSGLSKIKSGHPWLFVTDLSKKFRISNRAGAVYFSDQWWLYSPKSFLRLRRFGPVAKKWMYNSQFNFLSNSDHFYDYFGSWLTEHMTQTLLKKIKALEIKNESEDCCLRWIFSENDLIPGLIVDIFGDQVVCQINSAPIELFWLHLKKCLIGSYISVLGREPQVLEVRNSSVRSKEGLEIINHDFLHEPVALRWNGFKWLMTPAGPQKTGAYFDQRLNHKLNLEVAKKFNYQQAWDLCCYQGGFGLHLLAAGLEVVAIDQSAAALEVAKKNVLLNGLSLKSIEFVKSDVFDWLNDQVDKNKKTDLIILDPPSFVKSREKLSSAVRGYVQLNTLALKSLRPGGALFTCTCSQQITTHLFDEILKDSAEKAGVRYKLINSTGQSPDHAAIENFPEGNYLNAKILLIE